MKGYQIHPYGVLFHPVLDELNGLITIVYNWKEDVFHKVNSFGYDLLRVIEQNPGVTLKELVRGRSEQKVKDFVELMVRENIVIEK